MVDLPSDWTKRIMQGAALVVAGLGVTALIGWYLRIAALVQPFSTLTPIHRMTALGFLLSGVALLLVAKGRKRAAALCALIVLLQAVVVSIEYALGADFGIDQLLGRDYLKAHTSHLGRMSPASAVCFIGSSLALLIATSRRPARFSGAVVGLLASVLFAVGTVSLLGIMLKRTVTYAWGDLTQLSPHSSAAFALLGGGLLAWAWQESRTRDGVPGWLPLSIGLSLATGAVGIWRTLLTHGKEDLPLISHVVLAGGILGSLLIAVAVAQAQRARQRSRELQASSAMLQQLFETAPDSLVMTDREGVIVRVNGQAERIFGFSRNELLGHAIEDLLPEELHSHHIDHRKDYYAAPATRTMGNSHEIFARRKDGQRFPVEVSLSTVQAADDIQVLAVVRDITERKQGEEVLRQSEERFRSIFEQGPMGVVLMGLNRDIIKVNSAFCRMLGYQEEELTTMSPLDITHPDDRQASVALMELLFKVGSPVGKLEKRYLKKNGETMWGSLTASIVRDQKGRPLYSVGTIEDITERRETEEALRLGNEIFANMEEGVCIVRIDDGIIVHANPKFEKMFGYGPDELTGRPVIEINATDAPHAPEEVADEIRAAIRSSGVWRGEILHRRKDGTHLWCAVTVSTFHHPDFGGVGLSIHQDITELKKAQETLRESEERFRGVFEQGPIGVALLDLDNRMVKTNPAFCRMLEYSESELARMTPLDLTHPDDRDSCMKLLGRLDRGEIPVCKMEKRYIKKHGDIMWASLTASVIRDSEGRPLHGLGVVEDITERRLAQQKMAEQAALLDLARDSIIERDLEGRIIFWNRGAEETYGWTAKEALGKLAHVLLQTKFPIPLEEIESTALAQGVWEGELEQTTRAGARIVVASRWSASRDEHEAARAYLVINRDITARKRAEEKLRNLTERLSLALRSAEIGVWDWDLQSHTTVWDNTIFKIFGIPKVVPMPYEQFSQHVHPDDLPAVEASLTRAIQGKTQDFVEFRIIRPDGSIRHIYSAEGAVLDEEGNVVRVVGTAVDITARKQMEAQIEANKEQLVASARLSALGMMAGGIAHEINNPLCIIHALASDLIDIIKDEGKAPPEMVARNGTRIRETSNRIARIIKSLRLISREGSGDKSQPTSIGKILEETLEVCTARFKANAVKLHLPERVPELSVRCREVQIAQILLNLLQNAFDAVADQKSERWVQVDVKQHDDSVVVSVTDSGPGIPLELRSRIMEPFFTTKPVGHGTGLGLSLSRTIAEKHGGKLEYSEVEGHTRFSLVLPVAREVEAVWT
jgi:PAS domain S-box-containing protein